jgi:hypothetical protein
MQSNGLSGIRRADSRMIAAHALTPACRTVKSANSIDAPGVREPWSSRRELAQDLVSTVVAPGSPFLSVESGIQADKNALEQAFTRKSRML